MRVLVFCKYHDSAIYTPKVVCTSRSHGEDDDYSHKIQKLAQTDVVILWKMVHISGFTNAITLKQKALKRLVFVLKYESKSLISEAIKFPKQTNFYCATFETPHITEHPAGISIDLDSTSKYSYVFQRF